MRLARDVGGSGPPLLLIAGTGFPGATWHREELIGTLRDASR